MGFKIVHLGDMLDTFSDEECKEVFANFLCPINSDIEHFLREKSILLQRMGLSRTYFVYAPYKGKNVLAGYFAITSKNLTIRKKVSGELRRKITGFKCKEPSEVPVYLIGQLAKNYENGYNEVPLITGKELLWQALKKILEIRHLLGGRVILVECNDTQYLRRFYENNGFEFIEQDAEDGLLKYIIKADDIKII